MSGTGIRWEGHRRPGQESCLSQGPHRPRQQSVTRGEPRYLNLTHVCTGEMGNSWEDGDRGSRKGEEGGPSRCPRLMMASGPAMMD